MSLKYRPEIDGIRALAVVAVVVYHAEFSFRGFNILSGGFIGVDVFFVISGYLITSIILGEMQKGRFSFAFFYERRARRILPALFTVITVSIPFAWLYMLPKAMKEYAGSVISSLLFGSNIWFWQEDSYTAEPSALKPFLHTWSLSVEEQFYVVFPLLLLVLWKTFARHIGAVMLTIFLVSLLLAQYGSGHFPDAGFFLLPSRIWELLAGAMLAKTELEKGRSYVPVASASLPAVGLVLILGSFFLLNDTNPHPSFITLIPVLGTMLLIRYCRNADMVFRLLASKSMVAIGLLSYSFYLWHFPVLVFARIISPQGLTTENKILLVLLAFFLSIVTYILVEKPARNKTKIGRRVFLTGIISYGVVLLLAFSYIFASYGASFRIKNYGTTLYDYDSFYSFQVDNTFCHMALPPDNCERFNDADKPRVVLLGDSHGATLARRLYQQVDRLGWNYVQLTLDGCLPLKGIDTLVNRRKDKSCASTVEQVYRYLDQLPPSIIVFHARLPLYFSGKAFHNPVLNVSEEEAKHSSLAVSFGEEWASTTIKETLSLLTARGHKIIIVEDTPEFGTNVPTYINSILEKQQSSGRDAFMALELQYPREAHIDRGRKTALILEPVFTDGLAVNMTTAELFCDSQNCYAKDDEWPYYADDDHLNYHGASLVVAKLMFEIERVYDRMNSGSLD